MEVGFNVCTVTDDHLENVNATCLIATKNTFLLS